MATRIYKLLTKKYLQNHIIKHPYVGSLIFLVLCLGFAIIYKPLEVHKGRFLGFEATMAAYIFISTVSVFLVINILRKIHYFSDANEWTLLKEIISIVLILLGMGIAIYFAGFLIETPGGRWKLSTFLSSCIIAFLLGIIPFAFFTIINYRYLFITDIVQNYTPQTNSSSSEQTEEQVHIISQLKKEELSFYPSQFVYAESDGNYVVFYLNVDNQIRKKIIRNSISNIEQQLSTIPFFIRTHRAFIVNVKKVGSQKGNTLGYRLKLSGIDAEIPVSRQKTSEFSQLIKQYQ